MNSFGGTWDDEKCFTKEIEWNIHLDSNEYVQLFEATANMIKEIITPTSFVDLGGGMGGYTQAMLPIPTTYYDSNKFHCKYVTERLTDANVLNKNFTICKVEADLVACIEVMEHIPDEQLISFLKNVKCKYFHFSSTPHTTDFDTEWGHINIKTESEWIELFESCGFKFNRKLNLPTPWSLLFTK